MFITEEEAPSGHEEEALLETQRSGCRVRQAVGPEAKGSQGKTAGGDQTQTQRIDARFQIIEPICTNFEVIWSLKEHLYLHDLQ